MEISELSKEKIERLINYAKDIGIDDFNATAFVFGKYPEQQMRLLTEFLEKLKSESDANREPL